MWCGSLRPVSAAPLGCQIAKGKVIYTADTVAVAVAVGGGNTQVSAGEAACVTLAVVHPLWMVATRL